MELIKSMRLYSVCVSGLKSLQDVGLTTFVNAVSNLVLEKETLQLYLYPLLSPFSKPERCWMAEELMKMTLVFLSEHLTRSARPAVLVYIDLQEMHHQPFWRFCFQECISSFKKKKKSSNCGLKICQ